MGSGPLLTSAIPAVTRFRFAVARLLLRRGDLPERLIDGNDERRTQGRIRSRPRR
ncbi:hypothetical protein TIFTF001_008745 [Ficus carica]|uniref:Uncharacterized protein n=1 Tax=Ficus carica TaxID=3494 RepID=A0AA88DH69_FICCA|nr:hypothetical protein TIFTF001_008745 [Ficus carica]